MITCMCVCPACPPLLSPHPAACGNALCENGETNANCAQDCAGSVSVCPLAGMNNTPCGGKGMCLPASGVCQCFKGYTGDACEACDADFVQIMAGGPCVYLPGAVCTSTTACGGVCPRPCPTKSSSALLITLIVLGSTSVLVRAPAVCVCCSTVERACVCVFACVSVSMCACCVRAVSAFCMSVGTCWCAR